STKLRAFCNIRNESGGLFVRKGIEKDARCRVPGVRGGRVRGPKSAGAGARGPGRKIPNSKSRAPSPESRAPSLVSRIPRPVNSVSPQEVDRQPCPNADDRRAHPAGVELLRIV